MNIVCFDIPNKYQIKLLKPITCNKELAIVAGNNISILTTVS